MNRHIRNTIFMFAFFVTISVVTFSYAAFNTELMITGGAVIKAFKKNTLTEYVDSQVAKKLDVKSVGNASRYVGTNPNNYILYNGELWRIIGTFDVATQDSTKRLTKITRADYVEGLAWNSDYYYNNGNGANDFTTSQVYNYLYKNFYYKSYNEYNHYTCITGSRMSSRQCDYKGLSVTAASMVEKVYWNLGSTNPYSIDNNPSYMTPAFLMQSENGNASPKGCRSSWFNNRCNDNSSRPSSILAYVGLPYPSDFGYSVDDDACYELAMGNDCYKNSWFSSQYGEWTISPAYSTSYADTIVTMYQGGIYALAASYAYGVRPTMYLKEDVMYAGGSGTQEDPILVTYNGPIGIETDSTNYAPQGDPVAEPDEPEEPAEPDEPDEPVDPSDIIEPTVSYSVRQINGWSRHYRFGFTIENTTDEDINEWTIELTLNPKVTIDAQSSYLPNRMTGVITTTSIKANSENKYYSPNSYKIAVGETFDSRDDGVLVLDFNSNEVSLDEIFTNITVKKVSESFN